RCVRDPASLPPGEYFRLPDDAAEDLVERDEVAVSGRGEDLALTDRDARLPTTRSHVECGVVCGHPVPELLSRRGVQCEDVALRGLDVVDAVGDGRVGLERPALRVLRGAGAEMNVPRLFE